MVCTRYISICTDAVNATCDIEYQFLTDTPHTQFTQMMSNPLIIKLSPKHYFVF